MVDKMIEYYNNTAVNQSLLKKLMNSKYLPRKEDSKYLFYKEKPSYLLGDLVDKMLLTKDALDYYYVSELSTKPSDTVISIVHQCKAENVKLEDSLNIIKEHSYCSHMKDNTVLNKVILEGQDYYDEIINAGFKTVVSSKEWNIALQTVEKVENSKFKYLFYSDYLPQQALYFKIDGIECKALLDLIITEDNTICALDLKTTYDYAYRFRTDALSYRYDFQGRFYKEALLQNYSNVEVLPTKFLVVSTYKEDLPLEYTMTDLDEEVAWNGNKDKYGIKQALCYYKEFIEMPENITTSLEAYNNNLQLKLDLYV